MGGVFYYPCLSVFVTQEERLMSDDWKSNPRWFGIKRVYTESDVKRLRGSIQVEHTLAQLGAQRFWELLESQSYVPALGALTGNQAVQQVQAGLQAIYVSGWQVAADANTAAQVYPDLSLYPVDSVPQVVRRIQHALQRADQISYLDGKINRPANWFAPLVADAEAGFGGVLNTYELTRSLIEAGAAAIHLEDQLASAKKCGHMGGKVLVPTEELIQKLIAARLASDVCGVPTLIIARTDANGAFLLTSDIDPRDRPFLTQERTTEGFYRIRGGLECAIARALAYAPYADLLWCETSEPNLEEAKRFAQAVHAHYPNKWLAYNCSPSFHWKKKLDQPAIAEFQKQLGSLGYRFQFVTLAGFHTLNFSMFHLAQAYCKSGMTAYAEYQAQEYESEKIGYQATTHQRFVGTGYFDELAQIITQGRLSTQALRGSTEEEQFHPPGLSP
ncbi:MAG: isocitrate lyase [Bdellovibrionia bacterium]